MSLTSIPSVDRLLRSEATQPLIDACGRPLVADAIRRVLAHLRREIQGGAAAPDERSLLERVHRCLEADRRPSLRQVHNLTGTVLHTNLGRAQLPAEAVHAMLAAALAPSNLEFDLERGRRGDRDDHVEPLLCRLTGAEAATVVNNNAAAVLLTLNTLALGKEVPTSRGELIEIGGSFRMPDIMRRAGCRLREVGTTNRVHLRDYAEAIGAKTAMVLKVHTSNYAIVGFTSAVPEPEIAALCRERGIPFVVDLGSGTLVDLRRFGLPHEPTATETLGHGADIVTFSGDNLLGGPQAGIIAGRRDLVDRIRRNPLKRALRVDKMTMAALASVLPLYQDPERLPERLPTLRHLTRTSDDIRAAAERLRIPAATALTGLAAVDVVDCESEIGSGALPARQLPSAGLAIRPADRRTGGAVGRLADAFRALPVPVIGRVHDNALILDLRCLDDEEGFVEQLPALVVRP